MRRSLARTILAVFAGLAPMAAAAQEETPNRAQPPLNSAVEGAGTAATPMRVATREAPPFAMQDSDGEWSGVAISLFRAIADELDRPFQLEEASLADMIDGTAAGRYDAAVAALSITPEREAKVDFTFPYYSTGLGIAVQTGGAAGWLQVARNLFTWQFLVVIASLSTVLIAAGAAVWFFERRGNNEEFDRKPLRGVGDGFWWAAVTMTTVGYGDKSPRTLGGRIVGLIWMFTAMLIVASFTAAIAASLTVGRLDGRIRSVADLAQVRTGAVAGSTGIDEMEARGVAPARFDSVAEGLTALAAGRIDAFVHDRPLLVWLTSQNYPGELRVLEEPVGRQDYGIALPPGAEDREAVNRALLAYTRSPNWSRLLDRYLGGS